jgi:glycosyltransferase involved in cell wall biosynthesis
MKVVIVAEYYPRADDPARGVWAHRQAVAARDAGADIRVLVLYRPVPPLASFRHRDFLAQARSAIGQSSSAALDRLPVAYVRYLSPPRPWCYGSWGAWAAPQLALALRRLRRSFAFDLVHAHYAVPAGDAVRRAASRAPVVISVHGHDVHGPMTDHRNVRAALAHARLVLANSAGTAARCAAAGARETRVVHLGAPVPDEARPLPAVPTLLSVGDLVPRKRHADVIAAVGALSRRHPGLRYVIVGDGPERERLRAQAGRLGVAERIEWRGRVSHAAALAASTQATLFVLPSVDEAFGVAYVEAMAAGVPALACAGEDGPQEIAAAGEGIVLVAPRDPQALAAEIDALLSAPARLEPLGAAARETVKREFTWTRCGADTVRAYAEVLARGRGPSPRSYTARHRQ